MLSRDLENLPGFELVSKGVEDLARGSLSREALLVAIAGSRLREGGIPVPDRLPADPELQLYRFLCRERPEDAYAFYSSLLERLVSFEFALDDFNRR